MSEYEKLKRDYEKSKAEFSAATMEEAIKRSLQDSARAIWINADINKRKADTVLYESALKSLEASANQRTAGDALIEYENEHISELNHLTQ